MSKLIKSKLDPRVQAFVDSQPKLGGGKENLTREDLLQQVDTPEFQEMMAGMKALGDMIENAGVVSTEGLKIYSEEITSQPDGNKIKLQVIRPDNSETLPAVVYFHGGGMAMLSCFDGMYKVWGSVIAQTGLAVIMVDFRNSQVPNSTPDIGPFPAGLNDCASGVKWVHANAKKLGIMSNKIILAGDSGGGNLTLATSMKLLKDGDIGLIAGAYALCPFVSGEWPRDEFPSSVEHNGILIDVHSSDFATAYGLEHLKNKDPLAWPYFAQKSDLEGLPPIVISVNEVSGCASNLCFLQQTLMSLMLCYSLILSGTKG